MTEILTAARMRALEQAAIAAGAVTGLELMERAGQGVVDAVLAEWPDLAQGPRRAVVLCGPGNNGGDGFVVARLLKQLGWDVDVLFLGDAERLPADARENHDRWLPLGPVRPIGPQDPPGKVAEDAALMLDAALLVDALFGIGLSRAAPDLAALDHVMHRVFVDGLWWHGEVGEPRVVAVDVPSGLDADAGRMLVPDDGWGGGDPWAAHLTVTFHAPKPGHVLGDGPRLCTRLRVVDIGLPAAPRPVAPLVWGRETALQLLGGPAEDRMAFHRLRRADGGHKYDHGHALVLAGGPGRGGAARLAARAALRVGAGLVTLAPPPEAIPENAARLDAVMLRPVADAAALKNLLSDGRLGAVCVGPGFGTSDREADLLGALLDASRGTFGESHVDVRPGARRHRAVVLDADALTLLARHPELRARLNDRCVLTPHDGEFARLFPAIDARRQAPATAAPAFSKLDAAREAAAAIGCTVLLKGPDTVIAQPAARVGAHELPARAAIHAAAYDRAAPWLATAGSGDVLAGLIAGLLARGFGPFEAACLAAWLHVEAARAVGPGLIAEDLPDALPGVFRALGL